MADRTSPSLRDAWRVGARATAASTDTTSRTAPTDLAPLSPDVADAVEYFTNDFHVLRMALGEAVLADFEPDDALRIDPSLEVVAALGARAREGGWHNVPDGSPLHELCRGATLDGALVEEALGAPLASDLRTVGALLPDGHRWRLGFGLLALGELLVPVPREAPRADRLYLGVEALFLEDVRAALGVRGGAVVDLGAGAGHLGAVVGRGASAVVGTDILPRSVAMTQIAFALNPSLRSKSTAVLADVAHGLRARSFDLVVANPPWVPSTREPADGDGGARTSADSPGGDRTSLVYADGGPTGSELPIRFLTEGVELLRPGGVLAMTTLDPTLRDGRRPIPAAVAALGDDVVTAILPTPMPRIQPTFPHRLLERHPQLADARHVAVIAVRVDHDGTRREEWTMRLAQLPEALAAKGWSVG